MGFLLQTQTAIGNFNFVYIDFFLRTFLTVKLLNYCNIFSQIMYLCRRTDV